MGIKLVRFEHQGTNKWGVVDGENVKVLNNSSKTLAKFLENGQAEARDVLNNDTLQTVALSEVTLLSPVTKPAKIVCQGANYSTHRAEAGMEAKRPPFNMIFGKANSSLTGAYDTVVSPEHVKLLDYEIELGLVIGKDITEETAVTDDNLHEYLAGLVVANDISARDVQLVQGQWLKGKSYRTFCPTGPYLYLLDKEDIPNIHNLELKLWVNDEIRQEANTEQLLFKPAETIAELSGVMDFDKGDMILSGTTGGVALNLTPELLATVSNPTIDANQRLEVLIEAQSKSNRYLKDGDVIRTSIKSADGTIDLGEQKNKVQAPALVSSKA
ncbi:2-keto-4-pentenoate hydratase/2-oxohepta-3-ene-1,7-dioic acid hydratase (catechol pathway) [Bhargavaea ginsengi]|uniref:2-keto-4-pentenoate hydratase/2-oxohepta-3-ene-1,7-dioic acid hydratase (Catechol pathway) n=1 Tax=Bhargavaea ginsengi TaxID=426757 RepID=A0A1H6UAE5_9BACL|nr:fumarylacetoacetate hydrolase family protein [Bhargavaea ginsengi]SEI88526.1 2-keto-4-pentenoate hydratase/2-oxohepta-3-ene-1,7-dioic acid hydratase (catechol pathway) [Bhargavaea ginsengi]